MNNWIADAQRQAEEQKRQKIDLFNEVTKKRKEEIEKILSIARNEGLEVSQATFEECDTLWDGSRGNLYSYGGNKVYVWVWNIKINGKPDLFKIYLGVDKDKMSPSMTTERVEEDIKDWLVHIFSK